MEEKSSGKKKKTRRTNPPVEASVPEAAAAAINLTDDLIVEILSRLPAKSVHRFKCVSPSWRDLIADPAHRKKLPHTLVGFLYNTYARVDPRFHDFHFADVSVGASTAFDPSLPFLPHDKYWYVAQLDACNGLLLCRGYMSSSSKDDDVVESHYIVCNPATERWFHLPPHSEVPPGCRIFSRLAFDPAASFRFHVLLFEETEDYITGVTIYSSQTGTWKHRETRLLEKVSLYSGLASVFFHGMLHLLCCLRPTKIDVDDVMVSVDMEGQEWKTVRVPSGGLSFGTIGLSQGCLHYATTPLTRVLCMKDDTSVANKIAEVWCMKDYGSKEWVLKHRFRKDKLRTIIGVEYKVAAIHPDCDTIFLDSYDVDTLSHTLASYDMQHLKCRRILNLEKNKAALFIPYVPLFSDSFGGADGQ